MKTKLCLLLTIVIGTGLAVISCEGPIGPEGPQGPQGEQGPMGPPGPVGPAGADGTIIHAGEGEPNDEGGATGDFYLDLLTGDLYGPKMEVGGWGVPVNLRGPQGEQGPQGPQGPAGEDGQDGEQGPQGPEGPEGQDGEDGQNGEDGSQIFAGNGVPDNNLGQEGDYYLDRTNFDLYGPKMSSGWGNPINLQGPQGEQGPEGPAGTTDHGMLTGLGDDDHPQYLLANDVRDATNGFAVTGTFDSGDILIEGEGTRLMWYPGKAAFRAGRVQIDQWDDANIGFYSTAMGLNTTASGPNSTAMGFATTASGFRSTAMGDNTTASNTASTAMGNGTTASGQSSMALGSLTTASGGNSTAMGRGTTAAHGASLSIGEYNDANTTADNTLFVAGNGSSSSPSDALVLNFNGNMTIAGTLTQNSDRRLKTDIQPLIADVLKKLAEIRPVYYHFKDSVSHPVGQQLGLIAQEVQEQFPELVDAGTGGYLSLSYSKFTTVLLKGMQEQQAEIEKQEILIEQLRIKTNRVDELEARLTKLEQQRPAHTVELTGLADHSYAAVSRWKLGILLLTICCLILWHRHITTKPTRS